MNTNPKGNTFAQVLQKEFGDFPSYNQSLKCWISKKIEWDCNKPRSNSFPTPPSRKQHIAEKHQLQDSPIPVFPRCVMCQTYQGYQHGKNMKRNDNIYGQKRKQLLCALKFRVFCLATSWTEVTEKFQHPIKTLAINWHTDSLSAQFWTSIGCNWNCDHLGDLYSNMKRVSCGFSFRLDKARWFPKKEF